MNEPGGESSPFPLEEKMDNHQLSGKIVDVVVSILQGDPLTQEMFSKIPEEKVHALRQVLGTGVQGVVDVNR